MDKSAVEEKILAYLNAQLRPANPLTSSDELIVSGLLDSFKIYDFIAFLEATFALRFSELEMVAANFETAAAACRLVMAKLDRTGS